MKIINLKEFRKLPSGTIYSKYEPCVFNGLLIKAETWEYDYVCQELIGNVKCSSGDEYGNKCFLAEEHNESIELDFDCYGRDGEFEEDQMYAVYENEDIKGLIKCLEKGLNNA